MRGEQLQGAGHVEVGAGLGGGEVVQGLLEGAQAAAHREGVEGVAGDEQVALQREQHFDVGPVVAADVGESAQRGRACRPAARQRAALGPLFGLLAL